MKTYLILMAFFLTGCSGCFNPLNIRKKPAQETQESRDKLSKDWQKRFPEQNLHHVDYTYGKIK